MCKGKNVFFPGHYQTSLIRVIEWIELADWLALSNLSIPIIPLLVLVRNPFDMVSAFMRFLV